MPQTVERAERWRVPTHLDTPDGIGPATARQLALVAGAGMYLGPVLGWLVGPVGAHLGIAVPFVSPDLTVGQAAAMALPVAVSLPFAFSGEPPLEHGLTAFAQYRGRPRLLGGNQATALAGIKATTGTVVHASGGPALRAVWEMPSINTRLADTQLLAVLRERYAEFLNAIDFPFQVVVRSTPVDMDALLSNIEQWADPKADRLVDWLRTQLTARGLVERRRMLAVAAEDEQQLEERVEAIEQGLSGLDLAGRRVGSGDSAELGEVLQAGWTRREYKSGKPIGAQVVEVKPDALRTDGLWQSAIVMAGWPHAVGDDWLRRLVAGPLPLDVVWHVKPVSNEDAQKALNDRLKKWETTAPSIARKIAIEDAHNLTEALERGTERVWDVDTLVLVRASTEKEVGALVRKAKRMLAEQGARGASMPWEQAAAVASCQPLADNRLTRRSRRVDTSCVARTYPFGAAELILEGGVPIGETREGARPVVWTPYRRPIIPTPHLAIFGPPGSGKGVFVKVSYSRLYLARILQEIDVIDQDGEHATGEYGRFAEYLGGVVRYIKTLDDVDRYTREARPSVVVWNLAQLPVLSRPTAFVKIKAHRWKRARGGAIRSALIVDECWTFLRNQASADEMETVVRMGRHVKVSGVFMTQRGSDCLQSEQGQVILSSASSQWFGMLSPTELNAISGPLELSAATQSAIRRFRQGDGLLIAGPYQVAMRAMPIPDELEMAQTDYEIEDTFEGGETALEPLSVNGVAVAVVDG